MKTLFKNAKLLLNPEKYDPEEEKKNTKYKLFEKPIGLIYLKP